MLNTVEIIRKKRDGGELTAEEISYFIKGYLNDEIGDYQMSALLMAGFLNGMTEAETKAFTEEMLYSGEVLDFASIPQVKVDKHSTGGVGDKTSLVLAPIVAAAGPRVPMISGRGLGHTGGTLDKLESIPGFNTRLSLSEFRRIVETVGACIIGQTEEIAPADRRIYSLRDTTATVESIPFITASIMSKKLAEGIDALVLDVKCGCGAFMKTEQDARRLADSLVRTGRRMNKRVLAMITDMNQPLGWSVGNSLEVIESIETLKGQGTGDFLGLCLELAAAMLLLGNAVTDLEEGQELARKLISSGVALEKFREMVEAQGGDPRCIDDFSLLPQAQWSEEVLAEQAGYVTAIDTQAVGLAAMHLGAGRRKLDTALDYSVGLQIKAKVGDYVEKGQPLCTIYYNKPDFLEVTKKRLLQSYELGQERRELSVMVKEIIES